MHTVKASEFKARCLALMDEVERTGVPILVTKRGRPVAELRPARVVLGTPLRGLWAGRARIVGDIVGADDSADWDALK